MSKNPSSTPNQLHVALRDVLADALRAQPVHAHTPIGAQEPTAYIPQSMRRSSVACLATQSLPAFFDKSGRMSRTPRGIPAAASVRLEAGIIAGSRVVDAGAHVIVYPEPTKARPVGNSGDVVLEHKPGAFRTIEAAQFVTVADDADVPLSALPVSTADIDMAQAVAKGVRIEVPYRARKAVDHELLCAEIVGALTLGLARAADEVLMSAILGATPAAFTLGAVAAQGVKLGELRGLVGTAGSGASVGEDGVLRVSGVRSELTADAAATVIGAWDRAAVAIHEEVDIYFERTSKKGDLVVTAWARLLPLVPDPAKFWTAGV